MRFVFFILVTILSLFYSCDKDNTSSNTNCSYSLSEYAEDTTLYISYEINGEKYKYFQQDTWVYSLYSPIEYSDINEIRFYDKDIFFDLLITDENYYTKYYIHPVIKIKFWNYMNCEKMTDTEFNQYYLDNKLSEELKSSYRYTSPDIDDILDEGLQDTIFLKGVELGDYTSDTFNELKYDTTAINNFLSEDSYFEITDIEQVCEDYYKVSGIFATKTIKNADTLKIENGNFVFITE